MPVCAYSHVDLNCHDPAATERFYTQYFGFARARVLLAGDTQIVFLKSGAVYLELFPSEGAGAERPGEGDGPHDAGFRHLAFQVDDVDAQLAAMGTEADITLGPLDFGDFIPGWRTVWLRDPDGRIVEVSQGYTDESRPPARAD